MALIKCPECSKEFSDKAAACPNCGCPIEHVKAKIEEDSTNKQLVAQRQQQEISKLLHQQNGDYQNTKQNQTDMQKKQSIVAFFVVLIVVIFACFYFFTGPSSQKQKNVNSLDVPPSITAEEARNKAENIKWDAYYTAKNFVKNRLKSPSTANFPNGKDATITLLPDGVTYKIYSYVDSQNGFGAMIRTRWYAKLIIDGDSWKLLDLVFLAD